MKIKPLKIGDKLLRARVAKGYSRKKVADELDMPQTTYIDWEKDEYPPPPQYLAPLAKFLEINIIELIDPEWRIAVLGPLPDDGVERPALLEDNARNVYLRMIESQRSYCQSLERDNAQLIEESKKLKGENDDLRKRLNKPTGL